MFRGKLAVSFREDLAYSTWGGSFHEKVDSLDGGTLWCGIAGMP